MLLEIRGHHFPGRTWHVDGTSCHNVHVGVQVRRDPSDLVPGDSESASWLVDVDIVERDGSTDFRGPAVQGKRGERFVYLTWGDVRADGSFGMFRRAKLMLDDGVSELARAAEQHDRALIATVDLTDRRGGPRCARLTSEALSWSVE
jgi:hypothetical protein